ncbi:OpgC family protein [Enterovirga aerilata]|uniref:OpgC domain-containing protein n=1 Tax=Enterovirga aerilata TaxID=2730920 RepID=A0A849I6Z7_9HYPH|nr:OpgC domain-containing protein [Enterovirga sp. DB1703]NNM72179.1 OpgC domain-containing protein [Enterovirga sp. DB1703]
MRKANEVDFWRGLALVSIFINHIPGFTFERLTHRNLGLSDSAELFVFLAGWSLRRLSDGVTENFGLGRLVLRLGQRAVTLYAAQILITMIAIGLIAAAALLLENPLLLEWHNAAAVFQDPVPAHVGLILLSHQLGFFDILPLYVTLMLGSPALAVIHHLQPRLVLPLSLLIYAVALTFEINLPTWPVEGNWYFNPFAWQLVFVLGFSLAGQSPVRAAIRRHRPAVRGAAAILLLVGLVVAKTNWAPDPTEVPWPPLFFIFDKTFQTPARLIHFLALVAAFGGTFYLVARHLRPVALFLSMLGRNSLNVFCVGSLLSIAAQILRFALGGDILIDLPILLIGIALLGFTAWLSELRARLQERSARLPLPPSAA